MFLNSFLLWGAALGAVPVLIHLFNRTRHRPVRWAAMEFLRQAVRQNTRRLQIRDLVLMFLRAAAVVFLALALAHPSLGGRRSFPGSAPAAGAVLLLDNSYSMGCQTGRETRFQAAKRLAKNILAQLDKGTWCALLTFGQDAESPLGAPSQNLGYVEQELERSVSLSDGATALEKGLRAAQQVFREHKEFAGARKELYILTDLQARAWDPAHVSPNFGALLRELGSEASVLLIDVGDGARENTALVDLRASDTLVPSDTTVEFTATVRNTGPDTVAGLTVDFYVDPSGAPGERPFDRATVSVAPGESAAVRFQARFSEGGDHRVEARLPPDHVPADDRRGCTLEVVDEMRFLLVDGRERRAGDARPGETEYLRFALAPRDPENPEKQSVILPEVLSAERLGERDLSSYQAVVWANVERIPPAQAQALARQVQAGLGLVIFLGDQTDPARYNEVLGEGGAKLLPAEILPPWGEAPKPDDARPETFQHLALEPEKLAHPLFAVFNNDELRPLLEPVKVYRAFSLRPLPRDDVQVVAWLANGQPVWVERNVGLGRVSLLAFPATPGWTNLPLQGHPFTILMLRLAQRLTQGHRPPKNLLVGAPLRGWVPQGDQRTPLYVTAPPPLGRKLIRPEPLPDGRAAFEFAGTAAAGAYEVLLDRPGAKPWLYSVSPDADSEADLTAVSAEELRARYPGFEFGYVAKNEDLLREMTGRSRGYEIWPWFIVLVFGCLLAESFLARLWAPRT